MSNHLPECPHSEPALSPGFLVMCICVRLRACEQRIRLADDDYAYVAGQAEADGRRRGWNEALDAARKAVGDLPHPMIDVECECGACAALTAIDALRKEKK